jgi:hypothetical protein
MPRFCASIAVHREAIRVVDRDMLSQTMPFAASTSLMRL